MSAHATAKETTSTHKSTQVEMWHEIIAAGTTLLPHNVVRHTWLKVPKLQIMKLFTMQQ
jgi:hypothetical protein